MKHHTKLSFLLIFLSATMAMGDDETKARTAENVQKSDSDRDEGTKRPRSLAAIPLVDQSPTMGTAFGGMGLFFFEPDKNDEKSPSSILSVVGFYSNTDSYVFAAPVKLFLKEDTWRITGAFARFRINYDFDYEVEGGEINLAYTELRNIYALDLSRKIYKDLYLGFLYTGWDTKFRFEEGEDDQNELTQSAFEQAGITDGFESSLGVSVSYDTRDYPYYPTRGINGTVRPKFFAESLGGESDYTDVDYDLKVYHSLASNKTLAWRISGGSAFGDVPFAGYQSYGVRNSLRGYPAGKFRGPHMFSAQLEYRWRFWGRWGLVGFAGSGRVWGDEEKNNFKNSEWLPSIGGGLRFILLEERKINIRVDYGWGRNGNHGLYIGLMEAF